MALFNWNPCMHVPLARRHCYIICSVRSPKFNLYMYQYHQHRNLEVRKEKLRNSRNKSWNFAWTASFIFSFSNPVDNPLVCSCDILWLRHWLLNPHNRDNIESVQEHVCVTNDQKAHVIKALPEDAFNCPHPNIRGSPVSPLAHLTYNTNSLTLFSSDKNEYFALLHPFFEPGEQRSLALG